MKRTISIAAALGLVLSATALNATAAPKPVTVIEDPLGDANFVNDQGTGDGSFGDFNQADAGTVSDITGVDLSNDSKNLYVTYNSEAAPPAASGIGFRLRANQDGAGGTYCIHFQAVWPGANNDLTEPHAFVHDLCAGGDPVDVEILGTTLVIPRKTSEAFGKGAKLTALQGLTFLWSGSYPVGFAGPMVDTTKIGKDYVFKK
jgi:hypothetical protein